MSFVLLILLSGDVMQEPLREQKVKLLCKDQSSCFYERFAGMVITCVY